MGALPTLRRTRVRLRSLSPVGAEVWVSADVADATPGAAGAVRGRVMGPRCRYARTVEVAYPLRPLPPAVALALGLTARIVIPEPSLWDTASPHLYAGPVTYVENDQTLDQTTVRFGLRDVRLTARGLLWNGKPIDLRGAPLPAPANGQSREAQFTALRDRGVNLLVVPADAGERAVWDLADEIGLLVLYRLTDAPFARDLALGFDQHPSALGCLVPQALAGEAWVGEIVAAWRGAGLTLVMGAELDRPTAAELPGHFQFVAGPADVLTQSGGTALPWLALGDAAADGDTIGTVAPE